MTCNNICIYYEYIYIIIYIYARNRICALGFPSPLSMWIQLCHSMRVFFTHMLKTAPRSAARQRTGGSARDVLVKFEIGGTDGCIAVDAWNSNINLMWITTKMVVSWNIMGMQPVVFDS